MMRNQVWLNVIKNELRGRQFMRLKENVQKEKYKK